MSLSGLLLLSVALQNAGTVSDEVRAFDYLRQGRFREFAEWSGRLPEQTPLGKFCRTLSGRLAGLQTALIEAIQRGGVECDLKEVYPESPREGRIVAATPDTLTVQVGDRKRTLIWAGLPSRVTFALAERFLKEASAKDPALLPDLAEALGLGADLKSRKTGWTADLETVEEVRAALAERSLAKAEGILARRPVGDAGCPSLQLAHLWVRRLRESMEQKARSRAEAERDLPKDSRLVVFEDFEGGPELLPRSWSRGGISELPNAATPANRWCLKSAFTATQNKYGELVGHLDLSEPSYPHPVLQERLHFSCRLWGSNVKTVVLVLSSRDDAGTDHESRIEVPLDGQGRWQRVRLRLGDMTLHRPHVLSGETVLRLGDTVQSIRFQADRDDANRKEGYFCVDDLQIYLLPGDE